MKNSDNQEKEIKEMDQAVGEVRLPDEDIGQMGGEPAKNAVEGTVASLEARLKELNDELAVSKDKLVRSIAEFDNYRKRMVKERSDIRVNTQFDTISAIIPVLDHFELALSSAEQSKNLGALLEGMELIKAEFEKALSTLGVEYIHAVGSHFNPMIHEAFSSESSEEYEKDVVIKQWRTGYKIGDRIIRPATVVVSTGAPEAKQETN